MSGWLGVAVGLLLPFGVVLLALLRLQGRPGDAWGWAERLGTAYLFSVIGLGSVLWMLGSAALPGLAAKGLSLLVLALLVLWRIRPVAPTAAPTGNPSDRRWVVGALVVMAAAGVLIAAQAVLLPTLAWDAWNAWLAKPKAWFHAGAFLSVQEFPVWVTAPAGSAVSAIAASYPEALPRFVTWLMLCAGDWQDAYAHLAWPVLWVALGLLTAGLLRRQGVRDRVAAGAAAFLLTLPLISAHASLPGYADLWLASLLLLAAGNAACHVIHRDRASLGIALVATLLLPAVKVEGAIYAALLVSSYVLWRLPATARHALLAVGAFLLLIVVPIWGLRLPIPGLGWVVLEWGSVTVPMFGSLVLSWRPVAGTVIESLFLLPNWSLLWYLALPIILLGARRLREPSLAMLGTLLFGATCFHVVLFFFTDASAWAENLTSLNRLVLHTVPVWVVWLARLLSVPQAIRGRYA